MSGNENSLDILGIKPVGEAVNKVTGAAIDGASAFLSRICLPAAEEFGLLLRDRVHHWKTQNLLAITQAAERKLTENHAAQDVTAHPRLINSILEQGYWAEDTDVQGMWAGLLASSCSEAGDDDSNLLFVNLLSGLTKLQARILRYACEHAKIYTSNGLILAEFLSAEVEDLVALSGERDVQRLDRELDNLRALELLVDGGFAPVGVLKAGLTPSSLALHMYVRCQGDRRSPIEYFGVASDVRDELGNRLPKQQPPEPPAADAQQS